MGVPGLLRTILDVYKKSHKPAERNEFYDNFFIDFNGIIYDAYYSLVASGKLDKLSTKKIEELLIKQVIADTSEMINTFITPTKICYIAVDDSAPRAKMVQQRNRRYKRYLQNNLKIN